MELCPGSISWRSQLFNVSRDSHKKFWLSVIFPSSTHYHILSGKSLAFSFWFNHFIFLLCSGVFLALDIYRPKFSATSSYIVNTIRDNEQFLWICTGLWAVSSLLINDYYTSDYFPVCRNIESPHSSDAPILEARRYPKACYSTRIWIRPSFLPELLFWDHGLDNNCGHDRQHCRYALLI